MGRVYNTTAIEKLEFFHRVCHFLSLPCSYKVSSRNDFPQIAQKNDENCHREAEHRTKISHQDPFIKKAASNPWGREAAW